MIQDVMPEDTGDYKVVAANDAGSAESSSRVTVVGMPCVYDDFKSLHFMHYLHFCSLRNTSV